MNNEFLRWLGRVISGNGEQDYQAGRDWVDDEILLGTDPWVLLEFCEPVTTVFDRGARDRLREINEGGKDD